MDYVDNIKEGARQVDEIKAEAERNQRPRGERKPDTYAIYLDEDRTVRLFGGDFRRDGPRLGLDADGQRLWTGRRRMWSSIPSASDLVTMAADIHVLRQFQIAMEVLRQNRSEIHKEAGEIFGFGSENADGVDGLVGLENTEGVVSYINMLKMAQTYARARSCPPQQQEQDHGQAGHVQQGASGGLASSGNAASSGSSSSGISGGSERVLHHYGAMPKDMETLALKDLHMTEEKIAEVYKRANAKKEQCLSTIMGFCWRGCLQCLPTFRSSVCLPTIHPQDRSSACSGECLGGAKVEQERRKAMRKARSIWREAERAVDERCKRLGGDGNGDNEVCLWGKLWE